MQQRHASAILELCTSTDLLTKALQYLNIIFPLSCLMLELHQSINHYIEEIIWNNKSTYPGSGPPSIKSKTWWGFKVRWKKLINLIPCPPPLFPLTKINNGKLVLKGKLSWKWEYFNITPGRKSSREDETMMGCKITCQP